MTNTTPRESISLSADGLPEPGSILAGKYVVEDILGKGGMGVVLKARHTRTDQQVAIKILLPSAREVPEIMSRFEKEARAASRIQGPHVVRVYDVDTLTDGSPMMVMELLNGWDLGQELAVRGPLPYPDAVGYVLQASEAIAQAHRMGVIHRDIKPGNLFLCQEGNRRVVKVLDFGISKVLDTRESSSHTATTATFGTPQYMSPEQVRSVKNVDGRADVWSLGVVLYELLVGHTPFDYPSATAVLAAIIADQPQPLKEKRPDLPSKLVDAIMKSLEKRVENRYPDVDTFMAALMPFGPAGAAPQTMVTTGSPGTSEGASTRKLALISAGITALLVAGGLFFLAKQGSTDTEKTPVTTASATGGATDVAPPAASAPVAAAATESAPAAASAPGDAPATAPATARVPATANGTANANPTASQAAPAVTSAAPAPTPTPSAAPVVTATAIAKPPPQGDPDDATHLQIDLEKRP